MQRLLCQLAARAPGSEAIDPAALLAGTPALDATARVRIYADMFIWRQIDALRDDFPKLALLLGDGPFYAMAEDYLRAHPSRHASLSELGRELPAFLRSWSGEGGRADLADLAALEWARAKVFEEANVEPAPPEHLRAIGANQLPQLRLRRQSRRAEGRSIRKRRHHDLGNTDRRSAAPPDPRAVGAAAPRATLRRLLLPRDGLGEDPQPRQLHRAVHRVGHPRAGFQRGPLRLDRVPRRPAHRGGPLHPAHFHSAVHQHGRAHSGSEA